MASPYSQTEGSSGVYTATLLDESGEAVTALDTLRVWLRDVASGQIINSRNGQSLLNENGGAFSAGVLTWTMSPDDHAIIGSSAIERHEAVFEAVWDATKAKTWRVYFDVTNFVPIT